MVDVGRRHVFTTGMLLARPDLRTIRVPLDPAYGRAMTYRAVPLQSLLDHAAMLHGRDVLVAAADGFVTELPADLVFSVKAKHAEAWLAIEPLDKTWQRTPQGKSVGPFYIVWLRPSASGIRREQWPFAVTGLRLAPRAVDLWPQLRVAADVSVASPIRTGFALAVSQCIVCHQIGEAGDATIGPDLLSSRGVSIVSLGLLQGLVRHPGSKMPSFSKAVLSDKDIDAIAGYLDYVADRRGRVPERTR